MESKTSYVGRNQPCPCGSGKKYKHCCALKVKESVFKKLYNLFLNIVTDGMTSKEYNRRPLREKIVGMGGQWWPAEFQAFLMTIFTIVFCLSAGIFVLAKGILLAINIINS